MHNAIDQARYDQIRFKAKQDLDNDGVSSKDEVIYKGNIKNVENNLEDSDILINFKRTLKVKNRINFYRWDRQKLSGGKTKNTRN